MTFDVSDLAATTAAKVISSHDEAIVAAHEVAAIWARTADEIDRDRRIPLPELRALEASGLLAIQVPKPHGGAGLPFRTLIEVFLILAATDVSLAQVPQNHYDFVDTLLHAGPRTQAYFYPRLLAGARFGNALAEPWRKSRKDLATTIVEDREGYRVNGKKFFSTGALTAHFVPVIARHADGRFLIAYIERGSEGLDVRADWDAFGQRGTFSGTTVLDNVYVPADLVVHRDSAHSGLLLALFAGSQLIHAAIAAGGATGATGIAERAGSRSAPAGLAERLGVLEARAAASRALVLRSAHLVDRALADPDDRDLALQAAISVDEAKSLAYTLGPEITNELGDFAAENPESFPGLDRYWRNARVHSLHDPARWRQQFVGDYHLNGRLYPDLADRVQSLSLADNDRT